MSKQILDANETPEASSSSKFNILDELHMRTEVRSFLYIEIRHNSTIYWIALSLLHIGNGVGITLYLKGKNFLQSGYYSYQCCFHALSPRSEWTRFRGPNGSGISTATNFPIKWIVDDYNRRSTLANHAGSSPDVKRIYLIGNHANGQKRSVLCIDA